ncbi:unnamed protein product [Allacma fusca]|uniref:Beta-sarcoglycan n=1 Tax=Allacma fusca TaxID=39272 RepID=A0A8J2LWF0_9HEXA|nr:unnamed protein product [Allacma fusca]
MSSTFSSLRSSPIPDLAYDSYRSLSLREQTLIKRQLQPSSPTATVDPNHVNSQHSTITRSLPRIDPKRNSKVLETTENGIADPFNPNYVTANGKTYPLAKYSGESMAFWVLLAILAVLAIINALLTFVIFGVLHLGAGMESIEFLPKILKFYGLADLGDIFKRDGILEGLPGIPMEFTGEDGDINFSVPSGSQPSLAITRNIINITQVSIFRVTDKKGKEVFSTNTPTLGLPKGLKSLDVRVVKANRITSAINSTLQMRSHTFAYLKGSEGTRIRGKQVVLAADQDIFLKSINGNIILTGRDGVLLDVNSLPLVKEDQVTRKSHTYTTQGKRESQFQLCICMPEGKLFKVRIPTNNHNLPERERVGCHTVTKICK